MKTPNPIRIGKSRETYEVKERPHPPAILALRVDSEEFLSFLNNVSAVFSCQLGELLSQLVQVNRELVEEGHRHGHP